LIIQLKQSPDGNHRGFILAPIFSVAFYQWHVFPSFFMKHFFSLIRGWSAALLILWWLAGPTARAQAPAWQSAMLVANGPYSGVIGTATDANGNIYITGVFSGTCSVGSTTLTSAGSTDVFVAKWSSAAGRFLWVQQAGGLGNDAVAAIAVNGTSVYIAGNFSGNRIDFGNLTLLNGTLIGADTNVFVAKLTDAGSTSDFTWAQQAGTLTSMDYATALAVNGTSVYVVGYFSGSTTSFGALTLTNANATANTSDAFVAKLTDAGSSSSFTWAQRSGGIDVERATTLAVSGPNVYVAGDFTSSTADFGGLSLASANPGMATNIFITKLVDAGSTSSFTWVQQAGGAGYDECYGLAINGPNVYLTGIFGLVLGGSSTGGTAAFGTTVLTAPGGLYELFVAKVLDNGATGSFVWALSAGGTGRDYARKVAVRGTSLYVVGAFGSATATFGTTTLTNTGSNDAFVAKLTDVGTTGSFNWAQQAGGTGPDQANDVVSVGTSLYVSGYIAPPATFGAQAIASSGSTAAFLASLTDPTLTATTAAQGSFAFTLAPNPARAAATLTLPAMPGAPTATLTLTDALGRTLRTATVPLPTAGLRHELDLRGLTPGLYAVQVQAGNTSGTQRLVVE
jgi:hypothetical protein